MTRLVGMLYWPLVSSVALNAALLGSPFQRHSLSEQNRQHFSPTLVLPPTRQSFSRSLTRDRWYRRHPERAACGKINQTA